MPGGASGVQGAVYQQRYVAYRLLSAIAARQLPLDEARLGVQGFKIEGRTDAESPIWDVHLFLNNGALHLRECKDTAITLEDRHIFYRRIRNELTPGVSPANVHAGWVTDPDKQGEIVTYLRGMAALLPHVTGVPASAPARVQSAQSALDEALYVLCSPNGTDSAPLSIKDASTIVKQLCVDEYRMSELQTAVQCLGSETFESGTGQAIDHYICGALSAELADRHVVSETLDQFIAKIETGTFALRAADSLRDLIQAYSAIGPREPETRTCICWSRLPNEPTKTWSLSERLPTYDNSSCLISAAIGVGKTITSIQAFEHERANRDPHHIFRVDAKVLSDADLLSLRRLLNILSGLSATWIVIDAIDETNRDLNQAWMAFVDCAVRIPGLTVVITARQEVIAADPWLQEVEARIQPRRLSVLTGDQVEAEFRRVNLPAPGNASLIKALQTPLLFSLYARIAEPDDMPFSGGEEVSGFRIIDKFWQKTVVSESIGRRCIGPAAESQVAKVVAVRELVASSLEGHINLPISSDTRIHNGIQMLTREGVIEKTSTLSCRWVHDWVREYAIVDFLASQLPDIKLHLLVERICTISTDHVARAASIAGLKWIITFPIWGTPLNYLKEIWSRHQAYAREVLTILVEGPATDVVLADLPNEVLIEFLIQARLLRASQWRSQVMSLPLSVLTGDNGTYLNDVITRYELDVV